jgi:cadmium resistance protein CadD (predicted permease)
MSQDSDTFWVSLAEKFVGVLLIVISALMLYFTATSAELGAFAWMFGVLGVILLAIGIFLLLVKPPE